MDNKQEKRNEDSFKARLIEIAQAYEIPDFRLIYGDINKKGYNCFQYMDSYTVIHTSFGYEMVECNGQKVKVLRDYGDPIKLLSYRKEIEELCCFHGYDSFKLYYDGFRSFSLNFPNNEFK